MSNYHSPRISRKEFLTVLAAGAASTFIGHPKAAKAAPLRVKVSGLDLGAFTKQNQDPGLGAYVSAAQLEKLIALAAPYTHRLRTYGFGSGLAAAPRIAKEHGLTTAVQAWIGSNPDANEKELDALISAAKAGYVDTAIIGSGVLLRGDLPEGVLLGYVQAVRAKVPSSVSVTYCDTWDLLIGHPQVLKAVDVVYANIYPYFENASVDHAGAKFVSDYQSIADAASGKKVVVSETGWPSGGRTPDTGADAQPSPENQEAYLNSVVSWMRGGHVEYYLFEAFDEPYRDDRNDNGAFGILKSDGSPKPGLARLFEKSEFTENA